VSEILEDFTPDIVFYLAGVDSARGDRYGRLALSDEGLRRRDRHVLEACQIRGLPVVITLAGGYAATPERTAELHAIVFREAAALLRNTRREMIGGLDIPSIHGTDALRPSSE
jgi:acetoin utilization deacetylase AcuC-like enzyme